MYNESIICCYLYVITKYGYPPPAADTVRHIEEMKALGFCSIELEGIREEHLLTVYEQRNVIKSRLDELGVQIPYFCIVLPGLASIDRTEREKNLELFEKGCDIAVKLNARGVLDNGPLPPFEFPRDIPMVRHFDEQVVRSAGLPKSLNWNRYWDELIATYRSACDIAGARGLTYQIHPNIGALAASTDGFLYFRDAVQRDNLRFNLDTANLYVMKENLPVALRRLSGFIDYIHFSDNRGNRVEHLPPGGGAIDWDIFFETLIIIDFKGHIGLDIGGDESDIEDLDDAYKQGAEWLTGKMQEVIFK